MNNSSPITWNSLNKRQQEYMQAIYAVDQEQEEEERSNFTLGFQTRPASVWRWMDYATLRGGHTPLKSRIAFRGLQDEGTGSTFEALEKRGLITCRYSMRTRNGEEVIGESILAVQITKEGRRLVRQGLQLAPKKRRQPGELTEKQQRYADAIIDAGLAPREEVEATFRSQSQQASDQIIGWNIALRRKREEAHREYLNSLTRWEPCAYPGCSNVIEVRKGASSLDEDEYPQPARTIFISYDIWRWEIDDDGNGPRIKSTETVKRRLYACCKAHEEGVFRLKVLNVVLTIDEAEEARIQGILYPLEVSEEARWKVIELARRTAYEQIAQADEKQLATSFKKIQALVEKQLVELLSASDPATFTDNLEAFRALYARHFVQSYRDGLRIRRHILEGSTSYQDVSVWQPLYERRERQFPSPTQ